MHQLSRADARRIAVSAQLLDAPRPADRLEVIRHLTRLQLDQTAAVAPSADLVLWTRIGSSYDPSELTEALEEQSLLELRGWVLPADHLALYRAEMAAWPATGTLRPWEREVVDWVRANEACRLDILERLRGDGPLPISELPDTCVVPWRSTGWTNDKNVQQLVKLMGARGEVAVAGRDGRDRLWDLASRVYPDDPVVELEEALLLRAERQLRSLGLARPRALGSPGLSQAVGQAGVPATIEGVRGRWRVDPTLLERTLMDGAFTGRAALLSPLDQLVFDRRRMVEIFEFDYLLEMYKPAAARRFGYWALPILYGDRLVGKLDATADRAEGELRVDALHEDEPFTSAMTEEVDREIEDLARWLGLSLVRLDRQSSP